MRVSALRWMSIGLVATMLYLSPATIEAQRPTFTQRIRLAVKNYLIKKQGYRSFYGLLSQSPEAQAYYRAQKKQQKLGKLRFKFATGLTMGVLSATAAGATLGSGNPLGTALFANGSILSYRMGIKAGNKISKRKHDAKMKTVAALAEAGAPIDPALTELYNAWRKKKIDKAQSHLSEIGQSLDGQMPEGEAPDGPEGNGYEDLPDGPDGQGGYEPEGPDQFDHQQGGAGEQHAAEDGYPNGGQPEGYDPHQPGEQDPMMQEHHGARGQPESAGQARSGQARSGQARSGQAQQRQRSRDGLVPVRLDKQLRSAIRARAHDRLGRMNLGRQDLNALKKMGVVFDGRLDSFRFKKGAERHWAQVDGVIVSRDGAFIMDPTTGMIQRLTQNPQGQGQAQGGQAQNHPEPYIKPATIRQYISRSLHEQAKKSHGQKVRVTDVQMNPDSKIVKDGKTFYGWTATVNVADGSSYQAKGFAFPDRFGGPRGLRRIQVDSKSP